MTEPKYLTGAALIDSFEYDVWHGEAPERWPLGPGELARHIDFGPGELIVIGGAPGAGKTSFATAAILDAVRTMPALRAVIANVEMTPGALLNRQLARLSGMPLEKIQNREAHTLGAFGKDRIRDGLELLRGCLDRVAFLEAPFNLEHLAAAADAFGARCLLIDYLQRFAPSTEAISQRESIEALMNALRKMTHAGAGVIGLSAVARQKGNGGSDYSGLGLASFRGSSELEFAADSCYTLAPEGDSPSLVTLKSHKRRNGETRDIALRFERAYQRFLPVTTNTATLEPEGIYEDEEPF